MKQQITQAPGVTENAGGAGSQMEERPFKFL